MDHRETLRDAARRYLTSALAELASNGSLPGEKEPHWVPVYTAAAVAPAERDALASAIRAANPDRFATKQADARRYAAKYPPALLRGVITASRVASPILVKRIQPDSAIADRCIDELENLISASDWKWRLIEIVADLDVGAVDGREVHGVTLYDAKGFETLALSRQMPEAVQELYEANAYSLRGRAATGLLVVTDTRAIPETKYAGDPTRGRLGELMAAMRLATAATIDLIAICEGEPSIVHQDPPDVRPQEWESVFDWLRRPLSVGPDMLAGLDRLAEVLAADDSAPLAIALGRYGRSCQPAVWQDTIVDLSVALEAALIGGDRKDELTLAICTRAAHLLSSDEDGAASIYDDVNALYDLRSKVVHGGAGTQKIWKRFMDRHGIDDALPAVGQTRAFDRFRDIVRRAILNRLMLRAEQLGGALWRDGTVKVDRILVDSIERERWRDAMRQRCETIGLPTAWQKAPPLRDLLAETKVHHPATST